MGFTVAKRGDDCHPRDYLHGSSLLSDASWLPAEEFEVKGGGVSVGYVLDETDEELLMLREHDREVVRLQRKNVHSRKTCELDDASRPLAFSFNPGPSYPRCNTRAD
jgi:hypothetical protein